MLRLGCNLFPDVGIHTFICIYICTYATNQALGDFLSDFYYTLNTKCVRINLHAFVEMEKK